MFDDTSRDCEWCLLWWYAGFIYTSRSSSTTPHDRQPHGITFADREQSWKLLGPVTQTAGKTALSNSTYRQLSTIVSLRIDDDSYGSGNAPTYYKMMDGTNRRNSCNSTHAGIYVIMHYFIAHFKEQGMHFSFLDSCQSFSIIRSIIKFTKKNV